MKSLTRQSYLFLRNIPQLHAITPSPSLSYVRSGYITPYLGALHNASYGGYAWLELATSATYQTAYSLDIDKVYSDASSLYNGKDLAFSVPVIKKAPSGANLNDMGWDIGLVAKR